LARTRASNTHVHTPVIVPALFSIPWPDAGGLTALGTLLLAAGSVGGLWYAGRSARYLARQTSAAVEASFPYIRLHGKPGRGLWNLGGGSAKVFLWNGAVVVAGGTALAREVSVWARDRDSLYYAWIGVVLPGQHGDFTAVASPGMTNQCPFPLVLSERFNDQFRVWLGIVWQCPDRSFRYNLYAIQRSAGWEAQTLVPDRTDPDFRSPKPARRVVRWRRLRKPLHGARSLTAQAGRWLREPADG
jgi:hypothetical protein